MIVVPFPVDCLADDSASEALRRLRRSFPTVEVVDSMPPDCSIESWERVLGVWLTASWDDSWDLSVLVVIDPWGLVRTCGAALRARLGLVLGLRLPVV